MAVKKIFFKNYSPNSPQNMNPFVCICVSFFCSQALVSDILKKKVKTVLIEKKSTSITIVIRERPLFFWGGHRIPG